MHLTYCSADPLDTMNVYFSGDPSDIVNVFITFGNMFDISLLQSSLLGI